MQRMIVEPTRQQTGESRPLPARRVPVRDVPSFSPETLTRDEATIVLESIARHLEGRVGSATELRDRARRIANAY